MLQSSSWAKVSALAVVAGAGAVLGTPAMAAAQSAPVRIEKRVEVVTDDEGAPRVRVHVEDGEQGSAKRRAIVQRRSGQEEHRVIVRAGGAGDGECCCDGCPCCGGEQAAGPERQMRRRVLPGGPAAGALGHGGAQGKAIVIGPGGERREFSFGGDENPVKSKPKLKAGPRAKGGAGAHGMLFGPGEFHFGGGEGGPGVHEFRFETGGPDRLFRLRAPEGAHPESLLRRFHEGQHGAPSGSVRGHIVIMGPDGKEQVFDFGDGEGQSVRREIQVRPMELRDGAGPGPHLWRMQEDGGPQQERNVIRLRGQGGGVL